MSLLAQTSTQQLVTSSITAVTAQIQTLSTQTFYVSSINGIVPGAAFSGSTSALSTALITTSTLLTNSLTTSSITSYGTLDLQGNVLSNVGTEYFIKPLYTTTFIPTNISGLKVWLDASKTTSITSNGSGQVATWSNLTGLANATQGTASNTPVTGQLSINSLNTVQFNPTNEITFGPISYSTAARPVFAVLVTPFNPSVTSKGTYVFGGQDATMGTSGFHGYQYWASGFELQTSTGGGTGVGFLSYTALSNAGAFSSSSAWLLSYHPGYGVFINGTSNSTAANLNTGSFTDLFGSVSQGFGVNTFYVAEFLHYDVAFSVTQRQTVEGYLAWKWGIQSRLNGIHPYLSIAPPPLGTVLLAMGGITADTSSNISFSATNKIRLTAPVEIPTTLSTAALSVSSINSSTITQLVGQPIQSTLIGLGTAGYISTSQLTSTVQGIGAGFTGSTTSLSAATINVSTVNSYYISSVQGYISSLRTDNLTVGGPTGYVTIQDLTTGTVSTGQIVVGAGFISSLQINTLSFGPSGYVIIGDVIANSLSTKKLNTQALYTNNLYVGNVSTQSALLFPGLDGNFKGTAVAEKVTGPGTGELLLYKVSSTTDQIRLQTTGNIVFEAGATARSWPSTATLATPTLYIQGSTSNVGIGTATPAATLDVVGTARAQTLSTLTLNVSSINGAAPGGTFTGSTLSLSSGSVYASNVVVKYNGNVTSNTYGVGVDTLIVQTNIGALAGGIASLYFGASNATYPLARIGAIDYGVTYGNSALVFQTATPNNASLSGVVTYSYTGANQSFTVPSGITSVTVYMWGAGGGGGSGTGGAGAFIQGTLAVTPATSLTVIVGSGGLVNGSGTFGGGGSSGSQSSASGGGRSALQLAGTELVDVGGGGGGSYSGYQGGAANYSPTINGGAGYRGGQTTYGGYGGTQTAGGVAVAGAPISSGTSGSYLQGGAGGTYGGGGGGGFFGGGGGGTASSDGCAGGGGSSYTTNAAFTLITGSNSPNTAAQAPATASPYYVSGAAAGATGNNTGGSGLIVIVYNPPYNLSETMRISQAGNIGIGTSTPQSLLHVSGMTYSIALSTQALAVSSINGAAPWQQSITTSTMQGLGTMGYVSSSQLTSTVLGLTSNISSMIDPTELTSTITGLGTYGFISTVGLAYTVASTAQGLGTFGYTSTNQLLSTTIGIYSAISNNIATTVQPQFVSTVQGLGTAGYLSSLSNIPLVSTFQLVASSMGVGTGRALYQLDVVGTARAQNIIAQQQGTTSIASVSPLAVTNGNAYLSFSPQVEFQYNGGGYKHFMGSRHNGGFANNFGNAIDFWLYSAASGGATSSTTPNVGNVNTLSVTAAGVGVFNNSPAYALDVNGVVNVQTSVQAPVLSTLALNTSSINGAIPWQQLFLTSTTQGLGTIGYISSSQLTSTTQGLGTMGYISSSQLTSTVTNLITRIGAGGGGTTFVGSTIFLSATQVLVSTQTNYNLSSVLGYVSSLQVDELQIGSGYGIISFGDTQMSSISSIAVVANLGQFMTMSTLAINASSITGVVIGATFSGTLGTVSSMTALRYYGLTGQFANTAVAEVSTGTGTQELLLYKVSSISDQVRVQTTGNVIFEAGVGARGWPIIPRITTPTFYIAGSNSNVGVGTSNPLTTLDVVGTGRFQTLSSLNITAGSINYSVAFV